MKKNPSVVIPAAPKSAQTVTPKCAPIDPAQILTLAETAQRLKVSERWIYEKCRKRCLDPLPCIRIGRYLRFDWVSVSQWLQEHTGKGRGA